MKLKLFVLLLLIIIVVMPSDAQTPETSHMPPVNQALPHIRNHLNVTTNLPVKKSMPAVSEARIQDYIYIDYKVKKKKQELQANTIIYAKKNICAQSRSCCI